MSQGFPPFPEGLKAPEELDPGLEGLGQLEELLEAAEGAGIVDQPASDAEAALGRRAHPVRSPAIAKDLRLLGYLGEKKGAGAAPSVGQALARFQRDAFLEPDPEAGDETWTALRRLVTFEAETGTEDFVHDGEASPALARAVRLRLYALGVLAHPPDAGSASDKLPVRALARYWQLATYLGYEEGPQPDRLSLCRRVFDHDRIVIGISKTRRVEDETEDHIEGFRLVGGDGSPLSDAQLAKVQRFLVCVAKVELWLLGFDVDVDRTLDYPVLGVRTVTRRSKRLKRALKQFWRELAGRPEEWSKKMVRFVTPALFQALARIEVEQAEADATEAAGGDVSRAVLESVGNQRDAIEQAWSHGKSLGMRLWDGLKRVWRWIVRGIQRILKIGRNLARAFFAYANKAFRIARTAVRTAGKALGQYVTSRIRTGEGNPVAVRLAGDGDLRVLIPNAASAPDIEQAASIVSYFGVAFGFATKVLAAVLKAVRSAAGALAANVLGWARLVWILVRSYRELRPSWRSLRAVPVPEGW